MKPRNLWLTAFLLGVLCVLALWKNYEDNRETWRMGVVPRGVLFEAPQSPTKTLADLTNLELQVKEVFSSVKYLKIQPGLFLVEFDTQRLFVFTNVFSPEDLNPALAIDFRNDWTVLEKSSLLPEHWPLPNKGWVVLNTSTLSKRLKQLSLETQKPVIRPSNRGFVWLEKERGEDWVVGVPK